MKSAQGNTAIEQADETNIKYLLLHIGKTGGTSLGTLIRSLKSQDPTLRISKLGHKWTLPVLARKRPNSKIGFVIREPASRFVSGFNSRLRSGRPAHESVWKTHEAIVYSFFPTANDLAESLCSDDERLRSAAEFAMKNIMHLRRGYEMHLGGIETLKKLESRIYCVCDLEDLNKHVYDFFKPLGLKEAQIADHLEHRHQGAASPPLSDLAMQNLRKYWAREFEIYEYCRTNLANK